MKILYLFFGCIIARLFLVFLAIKAPLRWLKTMGYIALLPAIGFSYLFLSGTRKSTGAFGEKIWWNSFRPIHAFLYLLFAIFAIQGKREAWIFLLLDVCIGTIGFFHVHLKQGDFRSFL